MTNEEKTGMRKARRFRKTPCRQNRTNRARCCLSPSTKARWQLKLRILDQLRKVYPITDAVVEDITAISKKGQRKWNKSFSPLEVGKAWFYSEIEARDIVGGHEKPDNERLLCIVPLQFHRRQLHALQPSKGDIRRPYGSTRSLGMQRGSLVKHPKYGVTYLGGFLKDRVSLHSLTDGKRLCQTAKPSDLRILKYNSFRTYKPRTRFLPVLKDGVSAREDR